MTRFLSAICASALLSAGPAFAANITATPATYWTAIKTAKGGDVVTFAPGDYGAISLRLFSYASPVVIVASSGVVVSSLVLDTDTNMTWRGFEVTGLYSGAGVIASGGANIRFENFHVHGSAGGSGFSLRNANAFAIVNSEIDHLGSGIGYTDGTGVTITGNNLHDLQADGILGSANSVLIDGNSVRDFTPTPGEHPDGIQWYGTAATPNPTGIMITNNVVQRGSGSVIQCIFGEQGTNITIRGNGCLGTMYNGISVSHGANVVVDANFVQGFADMASQLVFRDGSSNVSVTNNTLSAPINNIASAGFSQSGNVTVPQAAIGDASALNKWLAAKGAPVVVPPVVVVDPRDAQIVALTTRATTAEALLAAIRAQLSTANDGLAALSAKLAAVKLALQ